MFTRKRFVPPTTKDPDLKAFGKALSDYLISLEAKGSLNISQATIGVDQGMQFPATQVASTDPNNLDDYEEGTFTPTLAGSTTAGTQTYSYNVGLYTKVGRVVHFQVAILLTAKDGTTAGNLQINGLPFTSNATANAHASVTVGLAQLITLTAGYTDYVGVIAPNTTVVLLQQAGSAQVAANLAAAAFGATSAVYVSGSYMT